MSGPLHQAVLESGIAFDDEPKNYPAEGVTSCQNNPLLGSTLFLDHIVKDLGEQADMLNQLPYRSLFDFEASFIIAYSNAQARDGSVTAVA